MFKVGGDGPEYAGDESGGFQCVGEVSLEEPGFHVVGGEVSYWTLF